MMAPLIMALIYAPHPPDTAPLKSTPTHILILEIYPLWLKNGQICLNCIKNV